MSRVEVRRAADRFRTSSGGVDSAHSFSFGQHYDPTNTSHGVLLASNADVLAPGAGYDLHPHRDLEIVTWVLQGALVHEDSAGNRGVVVPGLAQRTGAGRGIVHSERNDPVAPGQDRPGEPVRFVQMWVAPDEPGLDPDYEQGDLADALRGGSWVTVASGRPGADAAIGLRNRHAALHAVRLGTGGSVDLPHAPYLHLLVAVGSVQLEGTGTLGTGDAVRCSGTGGQRLTAQEPAELLLWEMHADLAGRADTGGPSVRGTR